MSGKLPGVTAADVEVLVRREKARLRKQRNRAATAEKNAKAAVAPNPEGFTIPRMPAGLSAIRKWVRQAHDAYSERKIGPHELAEVRRSATSVGDLYRVGADLRKAEAAIRGAEAQERMADALAAVEHGGTAVLLLQRLQAGLTEGPRRPLPGRLTVIPPKPVPPKPELPA